MIGDREGGTLVESLVAFAMFGMAAIAIYPLMATVKKHSKHGDVRQLCENVVRAKLDEYRFGRAVNLTEAAVALPKLAFLTVPTLSDTAVSGMSTSSATTTTTVLGNGGFVYAKLRYNQFYPAVCTGVTSTASLLSWAASGPFYDARRLGLRECVDDNTAWDESAIPADSCASKKGDRRVRTEIPGFKMYVKLQLETPWQLNTNSTGPALRTGQFDNLCPNAGQNQAAFAPNEALYDFDGTGDGIKVTVTGVMDFPSANASLREFAGLPWDSSSPTTYQGNIPRWTCTAAAVVRPELQSVRYYVSGSDGRIYNISGHGVNGNWGSWAFQNLYAQAGASTLLAIGRQSIAVHPRNLSVYVLKPGKIIRYSNCGGYPINCETAQSANGISDDGNEARPSVQEFEVLGSVYFIGVNFRSGQVYGMGRDMSDVVTIIPNGSTSIAGSNATYVALSAMDFDTVDEGGFPKLAGRPGSGGTGLGMRLKGFFIDPSGSDFYYVDSGANQTVTGNMSWASIYRGQDGTLTSPILTLPVDSVSFSK